MGLLLNIIGKYKDGQQITALLNIIIFGIFLAQELIQNAEDAGATEVKFLYDETQYGTETLWSKDMAQYQGKNQCLGTSFMS